MSSACLLFIKMAIEKGNKVKVDYEGKLETGEVFDSSQHGDHSHPIEFEVGKGQVIPGFENAVIGMNKGDEKEIKIPPQEAYGEKNPDLLKKIPKEQLPEDAKDKIQPGMVLGMQTPKGQQIPVPVVDVSDSDVTLDLNHPLAGKTLNFKIKVVDVA